MNNKEKYWLVKEAFFGIQEPDPKREVPERWCVEKEDGTYCEPMSEYKEVRDIRQRGEDGFFTTRKRDNWWEYVNPFQMNPYQAAMIPAALAGILAASGGLK